MDRKLGQSDKRPYPSSVVCVAVAPESHGDAVPGEPETQRLRCGFAVRGRIEGGRLTRRRQFRFGAGQEFWRWLDDDRQQRQPVMMFACGIGQALTYLGMWERFTDRSAGLFDVGQFAPPKERKRGSADGQRAPRTGILLTDDPPAALSCFLAGGYRLTALDTRNFWQADIEALADLSGATLPGRPGPESTRDAWVRRCSAECDVVADAVSRLIQWHADQEFGHWPWTIGGMALEAYRYRFMRREPALPDSQVQRDLERESYYQGMTRPLWAGTIDGAGLYSPRNASGAPTLFDPAPRGPFHLVDSSSFYGAIGAFERVPVATLDASLAGESGTIAPEHLTDEYTARVLIESSENNYPVRIHGRTLYARGRFWTALCGPELVRARDARDIAEVGDWVRHDLDWSFQSYAIAIWELRRAAEGTGDRLIAAACKALLARLHGKFAQRNKSWVEMPGVDPPGPWRHWWAMSASTGECIEYRSIGWDTYMREKPVDGAHCFPAVAAHTAAHGREWLRSWIGIAGEREALYCATDALIVTDRGRERLASAGLIDTGQIGGLRVVLSSDSVRIGGLNDYQIGEHRVLSGIDFSRSTIDGRNVSFVRAERLNETLGRGGVSDVRRTAVRQLLPRGPVDGTIGPGGWVSPPTLTPEDFEQDR